MMTMSNMSLRKFGNQYPVVDFPLYNEEQVKNTNKKLAENIIAEQNPSASSKISKKSGKFYHVPVSSVMETTMPFISSIEACNREYFGYDLYISYQNDFYTYNIYEEGDEYEWHTDAYSSPKSDVKLTCLINLSEDSFEGGEFEVAGYNLTKYDFSKPGTVVIFNPIAAHRVTPITKGKRITLSYWATGPSWR
mgnify:FL=1